MPNIRLSDPVRPRVSRLRCEIVVEHGERLTPDDYRTREVAEDFIRDMEKQGWHFTGQPLGLTPLRDWVDVEKLAQEQDVITRQYAAHWRYLLDGLFWREESIYTEYLVDEDNPVEYPDAVMEDLYGKRDRTPPFTP
jgi:hypothetical protein